MSDCTCTCHTGPYAACSIPGGCGSPPAHRDHAGPRLFRLLQAIGHVEFVIAHWADLEETRIPGTARPWRAPTVTPERREQLERAARAERLERSEVAPGETPMPVHADVLDVMVDIAEAAGRLAPQVATAAGCRLVLVGNPYAFGPGGFLTHLHLHLMDAEDDLLDQVALEFRALARDVALALRLLRDGQAIGTCPWCQTPAALVVHELDRLGPVITCTSRVACEPPPADSGTRIHGRPAWPQYEWDWLATRIRHHEQTTPAGRSLPESARAATKARAAHEAGRRGWWLRHCPYPYCERRFPDDDQLTQHIADSEIDPDDQLHQPDGASNSS